MKKLNNHGWGLGLMLTFIGVFALAIIIIVIQANHLGIAGEAQFTRPIPTKSPVSSATPSAVPTMTPTPTPTATPDTSNSSFSELEQRGESAASIYQNRYYSSLQTGDSVYVTVKKLVEEKMMDPLVDSNRHTCSGYVKITGGSPFLYDAYLKCGDYETEGYLDYLDS